MYYNQELGLCIEFGPVRVDSVRRGGGPPPPGSNPPCAGSRRRGLLPGLLVIACYLSLTPSSLKCLTWRAPWFDCNVDRVRNLASCTKHRPRMFNNAKEFKISSKIVKHRGGLSDKTQDVHAQGVAMTPLLHDTCDRVGHQ